jgi:HEAT repeat protein
MQMKTAMTLFIAMLMLVSAKPALAESADDAVFRILSGNLVLDASRRQASTDLAALGEEGGVAMARYLHSRVTTIAITIREGYIEMKGEASKGLRIGLESKEEKAQRGAMYYLSEIGDPVDRDLFLEYLNSEDEAFRSLAARGLVGAATFEDCEAEAALLEVLDATDAGTRKWTTLALGTWGGKQSIAPLAKALRDEAWTVRWDAAWGLTELNKRKHQQAVLEQMKPLLSNEESTTRALAAYVLGSCGKAAIPPLEEMLKKESNNIALGYAVEALNKLQGKKSSSKNLPKEKQDDAFIRFMSERE